MAARRKRGDNTANRNDNRDDGRATVPTPRTRDLDPGPPAIAQLGVVVTAGPDRGKVARASREALVIGTHASCDLVLQHDSVSRFHCDLSLDGDRAIVRD